MANLLDLQWIQLWLGFCSYLLEDSQSSTMHCHTNKWASCRIFRICLPHRILWTSFWVRKLDYQPFQEMSISHPSSFFYMHQLSRLIHFDPLNFRHSSSMCRQKKLYPKRLILLKFANLSRKRQQCCWKENSKDPMVQRTFHHQKIDDLKLLLLHLSIQHYHQTMDHCILLYPMDFWLLLV